MAHPPHLPMRALRLCNTNVGPARPTSRRPPAWPQGDAYFLLEDTIPTLNLCFGGVVLAALAAFSGLFWWRVYR